MKWILIWLATGFFSYCFGVIKDTMLYPDVMWRVRDYIECAIIGTLIGPITFIILVQELWEEWSKVNG